MPTPLTPQEFVAKWKSAQLKERSGAQEHFIDLCRLIGHSTPAEADPDGQRFAFEVGASKQRGSQGWADVWYRGHFAWEYKGKHKDLDKAYEQLLQYREALMNPPLLIVSDMERIVIHTNFTNTVKRVVTIELDDLLHPEARAQLADIFHDPDAFRAPQTPEQVTNEAARLFAHLADLLREQNVDPTVAAHFLIRLLFCLFAEDVALLPKDLFTQLVTNARNQPSAFAAQLRQLFQAMATGGWFGFYQIAHFDGRLFDDDAVLMVNQETLDILTRVSALDWANIEPSIFGTLFERSLDPSKRSQLGAHYTSKEDILLIVEPVLMAPLRRRWEVVKAQALDLARRRDKATGRARANRVAELTRLLNDFAHEIAQVQVLDAACGSGNFLYLALISLLNLWKEVAVMAADLGLSQMMHLPGFAPAPEQLHGIEINEYAHELAQATIWIGYIQWLHDNGYGVPDEPILKPLENILQMDAILAYDEEGKPVEPEWPTAHVVIGNPPFLGNKRMLSELGQDYVSDLRLLYADRLPACDLVCYWFERVRSAIECGKTMRAGLLATQAIRAGANRHVLDKIKESGDIFYAQADRPWILDGADVRVSMVGFDDGAEIHRLLNESKADSSALALQNARPVDEINANLTSEIDVTQAQKLLENLGLCFQGPVKVGSFEIEEAVGLEMLKASNLNGKPTSDVVRPWINASDITKRPRHFYIIDFSDMPMEQAALYEAPFEYVRQTVKPMRDSNRRQRRRQYWWQHGETVPGMRRALENQQRFIGTPRVAKHRVFVWIPSRTLPDSRIFVFAREDDYFFGMLHSHIHEAWSLATSSRHGVGNDPTYNSSTCFETFPFPWPPGKEPTDDPRVQVIAEAARDLVEKRDRWLSPEGASERELKRRTLTNLYNQRPTWLDLAHKKLDEAVLDAYGWPHDLDDQEILERLLALNLERAASNSPICA